MIVRVRLILASGLQGIQFPAGQCETNGPIVEQKTCVQRSATLSGVDGNMATLATSGLQLADPVVSARGSKSCALSSNGTKLVTTVGSRADPLTTPFGASSLQDEVGNRKSIEFRLPPQWLAYFHALDE